MKPVVVEMAQTCTFPDCNCDSPYRAEGACVEPAQAAERAVQLPPLPDNLSDDSNAGPIWPLIGDWSDAGRLGDGAAVFHTAEAVDAAIRKAVQDYGQQCYEVGRAAVAALPAAPAEPMMPDGYRLIAVNPGFDNLMEALDRADRKGYMPDAMAEEWAAFQWQPAEVAAPAPAAAAVPSGMVLVPLAPTRAMNDVMAQDEWEWRDVLAAAEAVTLEQYEDAAAAAAVPVPLNELQTEAAAKVLAECMDYPWAHMPEQGRQNMREHARAIVAAAQQPGGER